MEKDLVMNNTPNLEIVYFFPQRQRNNGTGNQRKSDKHGMFKNLFPAERLSLYGVKIIIQPSSSFFAKPQVADFIGM